MHNTICFCVFSVLPARRTTCFYLFLGPQVHKTTCFYVFSELRRAKPRVFTCFYCLKCTKPRVFECFLGGRRFRDHSPGVVKRRFRGPHPSRWGHFIASSARRPLPGAPPLAVGAFYGLKCTKPRVFDINLGGRRFRDHGTGVVKGDFRGPHPSRGLQQLTLLPACRIQNQLLYGLAQTDTWCSMLKPMPRSLVAPGGPAD